MEFVTVQWKMNWLIEKPAIEAFQKFINQCGGVAITDCTTHAVEISFPKSKIKVTNHNVEVEDE